MDEIVDDSIQQYAMQYSEATDPLLREIETFTNEHHDHSNMLSGPLQGKFLEMFSKLLKPQNILEIGTFTGYSALCLAKGLKENGELHTIELREEDANIARGFFAKSSHFEKISLHVGNALEIIPTLKKSWDIVFIDADKINYVNYYELTLPHLNKGGVIFVDNVLFHGQVAREPIKGKNAIAIDAFNRHVAADERVQRVIMTIRDGIMMIIKK